MLTDVAKDTWIVGCLNLVMWKLRRVILRIKIVNSMEKVWQGRWLLPAPTHQKLEFYKTQHRAMDLR